MRNFRKCLILFLWIGLNHFQGYSQSNGPCSYSGNPENWSKDFVMPGFGAGPINKILVKSDGVYVLPGSDYFQSTGGISTGGRIAKWNGSSWSTIGGNFSGGPGGGTGTLITMEFDKDSNLLIGGNFIGACNFSPFCNSPNVNSSDIIKWNFSNSQFERIGYGTNGTVYDIKVNGDTIYVAGSFTKVYGDNDTLDVRNIARFYVQSNRWDSLNAGLTLSSTSLFVETLDLGSNGELFAGGPLTSSGNISLSGVAMWTSHSGWNNINDGVKIIYGTNNTAKGRVNKLVYNLENNKLYVAGNLGYFYANNRGFAEFDFSANTWTYLVGTGYPVSSSFYGISLMFLDTASNQIFIGGSFAKNTSTTPVPGNRIGAYNYSNGSWNSMNKGLNAVPFSMNKVGNDYWIGGNFQFSDSGQTEIRTDYLAKYNFANGWSTIGNGFHGRTVQIYDVDFDSGDTMYVVGSFDYIGGKSIKFLGAYHQSKGWWAIPGSFKSGPQSNFQVSLRALKIINDTLYVGGYLTGIDNINSTASVYYSIKNQNWNSYSGSGFSTGGGVVNIDKIEEYQGRPVFIGNYTQVNGNSSFKYVSTWNGQNFSSFGNFNGLIKDIASINDTAIVFTGIFSNINGNSFDQAVILNSNGFRQLGSRINGFINDIHFDKDKNRLIIGGNALWTTQNSTYTLLGMLSYYDFSSNLWNLISTQNSGQLDRLFYDNGIIYLAGSFTQVKGQNYPHFARILEYQYPSKLGSVLTNSESGISFNFIKKHKDKIVIGGNLDWLDSNQISHNFAIYTNDSAEFVVPEISIQYDDTVLFGQSIQISTKNVSYVWVNDSLINGSSHYNLYNSDSLIFIGSSQFNCYDTAYTTQIIVNGNDRLLGGIGSGQNNSNLNDTNSFYINGAGSGITYNKILDSLSFYQSSIGSGFNNSTLNDLNSFYKSSNGSGFNNALLKEELSFYTSTKGSGYYSSHIKNANSIYNGGVGDGFDFQQYFLKSDFNAIELLNFNPNLAIGDSARIEVNFENLGELPAYGYQINFKINGAVFDSIVSSDTIMPLDKLSRISNKYYKRLKNEQIVVCAELIKDKKEEIIANNQVCDEYNFFTSISNLSNSKIEILLYPNPTEGESFIKISNLDIDLELRVLDLNGKTYFNEMITRNSDLFRLDLSKLSSGMYLIELRGHDYNSTLKVIKR